MNKLSKMVVKWVAGAQILAIILLMGCAPLATSAICQPTGDLTNAYREVAVSTTELNNPNNIVPVPVGGCPASPVVITDGKITICHATDAETNPYNEITVSVNGLNGHGQHDGDIMPVPTGGCPTGPITILDGKITICSATGAETNSYDVVTVSANSFNGYVKHAGDIISVPVSGCPTNPVVITDGKITICHATSSETNPYNEITVSMNGLNGHDRHAGDIIPVPEGGCPASPLVIADGKITICHVTGSETNPYNEITISVNGLNGHDKHQGDIIPMPVGGCPATPPVINNNDGNIDGNSGGKITICHATGSPKNPYNEITVSVNGLNGHGKHEGDIIPAPVGGCPGAK
jgi:hypothetical protein